MLLSFLQLVYCLIYFPCVIMLLIFYCFCFIFHICLFLIPNYFVRFFSFMVILLLFLLPSSFYESLFSCFLHFYYYKFAFHHSTLYHLFLNVSLPSTFSVSCYLVSLIIVLMFPHFSLMSILSSSSKFSSISNLLLISIVYSCFHFDV